MPREGLWTLNAARSTLPVERRQLMWIIASKDDAFVFAIAQSDAQGPIDVLNWSGRPDGVMRPVAGSALSMAVSAEAAGLRIEGRDGMGGRFEEHCRLSDGGKRMRCEGARYNDAGGAEERYVEDYDWASANPATFQS
jgi:hypothetical protein